MSLSGEDLQAIRKIVEETVISLKGELEALRNDMKEIYTMLAVIHMNSSSKQSFQKLNVEEKLLNLHSDLLEAAKQAGVTLPSH